MFRTNTWNYTKYWLNHRMKIRNKRMRSLMLLNRHTRLDKEVNIDMLEKSNVGHFHYTWGLHSWKMYKTGKTLNKHKARWRRATTWYGGVKMMRQVRETVCTTHCMHSSCYHGCGSDSHSPLDTEIKQQVSEKVDNESYLLSKREYSI